MKPLRRVLRDRSGRLVEIQILAAFLILGALISFGQRSILKGYGIATLWLLGLFLFILGAMFLQEGWERLLERERVKAFLASPTGRGLRAALIGLAAGVAAGAVAAFASIFLAPALAKTPSGQLLAMRALTGGAACAAGGLAAARAWNREAP